MDRLRRSDIDALQGEFAAALRVPEAAVPQSVRAPDASQLTRRFNVYRNTVHASLAAALAARFPVVQRLVGDEFFQAMALSFVERAPPTSPILAKYGAEFPAFLASFAPAQDLPYLADVARLEWTRSEAYHAGDARPLGIDALQSVRADLLPDVRLHVHPAARVIVSEFPVVAIWMTNTHDAVIEPIALDAGGETALVTRPHLDLLVTRISRGAAALLMAFDAGSTLGAAVEAAQAVEPSCAVGECLAQFFVAGAIAGLSSPH